MDFETVRQLVDAKAQEGLNLDFKRGDALAKGNQQRSELVKDVTGMANGAGGTILYGIAEDTVDGIGVASALAPVTDAGIHKEWITQVLRANTSPPLGHFDITEVPVPAESGGGRVIAVQVEASSTAHQNLYDKRYYLRAGATTEAMVDFQIRDVMNRRTKPVIDVKLRRHNLHIAADLHRYLIIPTLANVGAVSIEKWQLEIDLPRLPAERGFLQTPHAGIAMVVQNTENDAGHRVVRAGVGDPLWDGRSLILHPGRELALDQNLGLPQLTLEVDEGLWEQLRQVAFPIRWRLFLLNAPPMGGELLFEEWCIF